jgi:hypothetical protein
MDASLVTPKQAVRTQWNEAAIHKHCQSTNNRLFICPAENQIQDHRLTLAECYGVVVRCAGVTGDGKWNWRRVNDLPDVMQITISMKVTYGNLKY